MSFAEDRQQSDRKMRDNLRALAENNRPERTLPALPVSGGWWRVPA